MLCVVPLLFLVEIVLEAKLHESPREQWTFEVHSVQSPFVRRCLQTSPLPLGFPHKVSFACRCPRKRPVFVAGIETVAPYVLLHVPGTMFFSRE